MKKIIGMFAVLVLVSCSDQYMVEKVTGDTAVKTPVSEIDILKEKVRWGDGEACLKLADCYRDGLGVKTDFLNMMYTLTLAEDYGAINKAQDYFKEYPANNEVEYLSNWVKDADDREAFQGIMAIERGDTLLGRQKIEAAAQQENPFAMLLVCTPFYSGIPHGAVERMLEIADKVPLAYKILGDIYSGVKYEYLKDEALAASYYLKADQHICIGKAGARWLLNYYHDGGNLQLSESDLERLQILSEDVVDEVIEIVDEDDVEDVDE